MVAERIREAMSEMKPPLSQAELADHLGVKPNVVSRWLAPTRRIRLEELARIAVITRKPLGWFLPQRLQPYDVESVIEADDAITVAERQALKETYRAFRDRRRDEP